MAAAIEEIRVDGEIEALPADLQFLRKANANGIIGWFVDKARWNQNARCMSPIVWRLLEKRIREHPNEAREVVDGGGLAINNVLRFSYKLISNTAAPLSLVQLLIELHPDGLQVQDDAGSISLHWAVDHPCIDCFRAVLYNGDVEATTIQTISSGETPLAWSTDRFRSLAMLWELLRFNRDCITIQDSRGRTALDLLEEEMIAMIPRQHQVNRQNAKIVLLKLAANYNHVPKVPNDATIAILESHPVCTVLAPRLEPGRDAFILHRALEAKCPHVLAEALVQIFQNQIQQVDTNGRLPLHIALHHGLGASVRLLASKHRAAMHIIDPVTWRLPIEQAILNVGKHDSLENADAVDALLRADPSFLL
jgi:hypothetical protein